MGILWLAIPALIFLARKPPTAPPAEPSTREQISAITLQANMIAADLRAGGLVTKRLIVAPPPDAPGAGGWRGLVA